MKYVLSVNQKSPSTSPVTAQLAARSPVKSVEHSSSCNHYHLKDVAASVDDWREWENLADVCEWCGNLLPYCMCGTESDTEC